jgi:tRNA dimethylallyltransferase
MSHEKYFGISSKYKYYLRVKMNTDYSLITILGPTASGKTSFAAALAANIGSEIISGDSRQMYRGMDIGTGKDLADYHVDGKDVPYHLIDTKEAGYKYNLFEYQHDFHRAYDDIRRRGMTPILCGGTGLYIEAVLKGYKLLDVPPNPELRESLKDKSLEELEQILRSYKTLHNKTDVDSAQRAIRAIEIEEFYLKQPADARDYDPIDSLIIGVDIDREARREKISKRLRSRLDEGMVEEVRGLLDRGIAPDDLIYYGLEYKFLTLYIIGKLSYEEMVSQLEIAIHQFAKRQMTWFRGMERRGFHINWMDYSLSTDEKIARILELLSQKH